MPVPGPVSCTRRRTVAMAAWRALPRVVAALVAAAALALSAVPAAAQTNNIFTLAGTGIAGFNGDGIAAGTAQLNVPVDVESTPDGGYLITDQINYRIRRVSPAGTITTVAGTGTSGFGGDGGPATSAQISIPNGLVATSDGGFLFADSNNHRVRRVTPAGTISTVAGTGAFGFSGDGTPAVAAQLNFPAGVALTPDGGFLISDNDNHRVRKVSAGGTITTVAGTGVAGFSGDNGPATAAQINDPGGIAAIGDGSYLIADINNHRVRRVSAGGTITTAAGSGSAGYTGDGGPAGAAQLNQPSGVAVLPGGGYLIGDRLNHAVRAVTAGGTIGTVAGTGTPGGAGNGGPAAAAQLNQPIGVTVTPDGDYLIADAVNHAVRLVDAAGLGITPPPPVPDFSLAIGPGGPPVDALLVVPPGGRISLPISVLRNISSSGRIALSVSGLPAGVTASFEPAELGGRASTSTLMLTATAGATPASGSIRIGGAPVDASAGGEARSLDMSMVVQGSLAARVEGIEVTQAVQTTNQPRMRPYSGVALVKHKKTVVRVFADFIGREVAGAGRPALGMALFVKDAGGRLMPGSPIFPEWAPPSSELSLNDIALTATERGSPRAFTFVLPDAWTRAPITLEARALGSTDGGAAPRANALCLATSCGATPTRDLAGVTFRDPPRAAAISALQQLVVYHALLDPTDPTKGPNPSGAVTGIGTYSTTAAQAFAKLLALSPVPFHFYDSQDREADWPRYRATRFASDTAIWEPADQFDQDIGRPGLATVGLFVLGNNPGVTIGHTSVVSVRTNSPGVLWRPVTSVAHEVFHRLGFKHASTSCGAGDGEPWPVADGRLDSVGLDPTPSSGGAAAGSPPYRTIVDTAAFPAYDLMSYCGITSGDAPHWISARNWNRALGVDPPRAVKKLGKAKVLTVRAQIARSEIKVVSITPATGPPAPAGVPSAYVVAARDVGGRLLATVAVLQNLGSGAAGLEPFTTLEAEVPSTGVARIEVLSGDSVVAARDRSARAPRARLLAPGAGSRVGATRAVPVRWRVSDADRDPVEVRLDYSRDGGRTFHNVWSGPDRGSAQIPTELLDATTNARLRLRANDGFNETSTTSARFVVVARGPRVEILEPGPGQRADAGGTVLLRGAAVDDGGRAIAGARLRWLVGGRVIARGESVGAVLPPGARRLTLQATDGAGRVATDTVALRVRAATPFFVRLSAPRTLSRRARSLTIVVSATQPAALRVGARRFAVGPRGRRLRIPVAAGRSTLRLQLTLSAGGKSSRRIVVVTRR